MSEQNEKPTGPGQEGPGLEGPDQEPAKSEADREPTPLDLMLGELKDNPKVFSEAALLDLLIVHTHFKRTYGGSGEERIQLFSRPIERETVPLVRELISDHRAANVAEAPKPREGKTSGYDRRPRVAFAVAQLRPEDVILALEIERLQGNELSLKRSGFVRYTKGPAGKGEGPDKVINVMESPPDPHANVTTKEEPGGESTDGSSREAVAAGLGRRATAGENPEADAPEPGVPQIESGEQPVEPDEPAQATGGESPADAADETEASTEGLSVGVPNPENELSEEEREAIAREIAAAAAEEDDPDSDELPPGQVAPEEVADNPDDEVNRDFAKGLASLVKAVGATVPGPSKEDVTPWEKRGPKQYASGKMDAPPVADSPASPAGDAAKESAKPPARPPAAERFDESEVEMPEHWPVVVEPGFRAFIMEAKAIMDMATHFRISPTVVGRLIGRRSDLIRQDDDKGSLPRETVGRANDVAQAAHILERYVGTVHAGRILKNEKHRITAAIIDGDFVEASHRIEQEYRAIQAKARAGWYSREKLTKDKK